MSNPTPPVSTSSNAIDYQPLSGWAVAGFLMGVLYMIAVIGSAVLSLVRGEPFFLPGWTYAWALAAISFCLIGQWQIRNAEGTRAGATLAKLGLWISLLTSLGYFAYVRFTELALTQQANDFLMVKGPDQGFFPRLKDGSATEINHAFLLTKSPIIRARLRPEDQAMMARYDDPGADGTPGELTQFHKRLLTRAIKQGGEQTKIEPMGVKSWNWEKGGYRVERNYRITTPEVVFDVIVPVQSMTVKAQRKWFVVADYIQLVKEELTERGEDQAMVRMKALTNFPSYFGIPKPKKEIPIELVNNRFGVDDGTIAVVRKALRKAIYGGRPTNLRGFSPDEKQLTPIKKVNGKLQLTVPFSAAVLLKDDRYVKVEGKMVLQAPAVDAMLPGAWRPTRVMLHWLYATEGSSKR